MAGTALFDELVTTLGWRTGLCEGHWAGRGATGGGCLWTCTWQVARNWNRGRGHPHILTADYLMPVDNMSFEELDAELDDYVNYSAVYAKYSEAVRLAEEAAAWRVKIGPGTGVFFDPCRRWLQQTGRPFRASMRIWAAPWSLPEKYNASLQQRPGWSSHYS